MAIPDFQTLMLPVLRLYADCGVHSKRDVLFALAKDFSLTEEELSELLPSGRQARFDNRVAWAKSYLKQAGFLDNVGRGMHRISARGLEVLATNPPKIDIRYLEQFEEYRAFKAKSGKKESPDVSEFPDQGSTPEELLEAGYRQLRNALASDLLQQVKTATPAFFERLVVDLLVRMGYGGTREDAGRVLGKSGDGGIDGIINEDRLGLDVIYLQAKKWEGDVGRPEIQKFVGALAGQHAAKGVFLTTSGFTKEARSYASQLSSKVVLIDGPMLADLMIDYGLGVATMTSYEIKRIDSDYFTEE
jgi:restriction system protein